MRVLVTGGSGKLGRACIRDLIDHGYEVVNADVLAPVENLCPYIRINLEDAGQVFEAVGGFERFGAADAIVHLAAVLGSRGMPNTTTFRINTLSTYNVFEAARRLGVKNVVWASSETLLGNPYPTPPPYVPVDEEYDVRPESAYALSKAMGEEMARQFCRWDSEQKIIGLRIASVREPSEYANFDTFQEKPSLRRQGLWGYLDVRDGAQAIRKALEADLRGADVFNVANEETVMLRLNSELLAEFYPTVPSRADLDNNKSLICIDKARRVLGYAPEHHWWSEE